MPPLPHAILGIDIGTSSTKVSAFTRQGEVLATSQQAYPLWQPEAGFVEQDPEVIFEAVVACLGNVLADTAEKCRVTALSFSAAMHGIMALDGNGIPLTHIITWADTRSQADADEISNSDEAAGLYLNTGVPIHPMSPLCKIRWLNRHRPEIMEKARMFAGIKEYVIFKLTGQWAMDHSLASATGLFDIRRLDWYQPALSLAGVLRDQLPTLVSPLHKLPLELSSLFRNSAPPSRNLSRDLRDAGSEIQLVAGASDGCLANLGSGAMEPGLLALTIGTSGAVRMSASEPAPDAHGRTFNYVLWPGSYVTGGPINNGGIILKWFSEEVLGKPFRGAEDFKWFLEEACSISPGSDGITCLPWFMGERAPIWDASATGTFYGITLRHSRAHLMRAIVEGISFSLYSIADMLSLTAGPFTRILASGGFTASPEWVQMIADIFGKPVQVAQDTDASATGAAMLGFIAMGEATRWEDFRSWMDDRQTYTPEPMASARYRDFYQRFDQLAGIHKMNH